MGLMVLNSIDFKIDRDSLLKRLHIDKDMDCIEDILELTQIAGEIGRPKAMYKEAIIDFKGHDYIIVDGIKFTSHIMRVNLESVDRIFPYICTCGSELNEWAESLEGILEQYWVDKIMEIALEQALVAFEKHLEANFKLWPTSNMNPGSLEDWPISQQKELFSLLGDPHKDIGVELTDSFLMLPIKSVSGIRFSTDIDFENCLLCSRASCQSRRSEFDHNLYNQRYKK